MWFSGILKRNGLSKMILKQFFDTQSSTFTYVVASRKTQDALIIDSVAENTNEYIDFLNQNKLNLLYALDTHIHADHISGINSLQEQTSCKALMGEKTDAKGLSKRLKHNELISLGDLSVQVLFTPGHTSDSYCFLVAGKLFTGDTLLIGETGRTDFQNGNPASAYNSIFNILLKLPENTEIYPGHDYNGNTMSTIGDEKKTNPRLQVKSEHEYIELMKNLDLPKPKKMDIAIPRNLKLGKE